MALKCRIVDSKVVAPNGKISKLYLDLEDKFGEDRAFEFYALTETSEYKDALGLDVDSNGEMTVDNFLRFSLLSEREAPMTKEVTEFLQKFSEEEITKLQSLYNQGIFNPTQKSLNETGLFSQDEIVEILYSFDKRQNLKNFIESFEGADVSTVKDFRVEQQDYNSIGMKPLKNPEEIQKDVLRRLNGTSLEELDVVVETLPYPSIVQAYKNDESFRETLRQLVYNSNVIVIERDPRNTIERLYNTMDVESIGDLSLTVRRISDLNDKDLIIEEFEVIVNELIVTGVEIDFDEASLRGKTVEQLKNFAKTLQSFVDSPTVETTNAFAAMVDEFSEKKETEVVTMLNNNIEGNKLRFFDSNKNEVEAFEENSLIKYTENVYQKVNNSYSVDQLYDFLYQKIITSYNPSLIPSAENSVEKLLDPINKEAVLADIKNMVRENTKYLPFSDVETQEKITIYKMFYGAPLQNSSTKGIAQPVEDQQYLEGQFLSDFNRDRLIEKEANSEIYNNFYKHFIVDHKGIRLNYQNEFSIASVLANVPEGLKDSLVKYAQISKYLDLGQDVSQIDQVYADRLKAQQYPESVKRLEGDYQIASTDEIISEETEQFVNVRGDVYEKVLSFKDKSLYKKLPVGVQYLKILTLKSLYQINHHHILETL